MRSGTIGIIEQWILKGHKRVKIQMKNCLWIQNTNLVKIKMKTIKLNYQKFGTTQRRETAIHIKSYKQNRVPQLVQLVLCILISASVWKKSRVFPFSYQHWKHSRQNLKIAINR